MSLTERQWQASLDLVGSLNDSLDNQNNRLHAGNQLLRLLDADYFASYLWSPKQQHFEHACSINIDTDNLQRYEQHYQFCDPITPTLQHSKNAISVNQVINQQELLKTEFYNDFLAKDGLYHGINLYVFDPQGNNLGDFRIWRNKNRANFDQSSLEILDIIAPHFQRSLLNSHKHQQALHRHSNFDNDQLTKREQEILQALWRGGEQQLNDQQVAAQLNISVTTLRTHIRHIYDKCQVNSRSALWAKIKA